MTMTPEQLISLYTITVAIVTPVSGATIWAVQREKTRRVQAIEKSVGAQAVFTVMNHLEKLRLDINHLKDSDEDRSEEIRVLEEDYKKLTILIIELLKIK